jgi:hypothetical protein
MSADWDRGVEILRPLSARFAGEPERVLDVGVAEALGIQFRSGYNILRFYRLREEMLRMEGTRRLDLLGALGDIVREELALDERLLLLCERDSRLGFHSEAEGYKYYPEKIRWRMGQLRQVLAQDVPELERLIREGEPLFPEYTGRRPTGAVAHCTRSDGVDLKQVWWSSPDLDPPPGVRWQPCSYGASEAQVQWGATWDGEALYVVLAGARGPADLLSSVLVKIEPRRLWPCKHLLFAPGGATLAELPDKVTPQTVEGHVVGRADAGRADAWRAVLRIPLERVGLSAQRPHPVRLDVQVEQKGLGTCAWRPSNPVTPRLFLGTDNPADLGWLLFEGTEG